MKTRHCTTIAIAVLLSVLACALPAAPAERIIYSDSLQNGWQNWGWATLDYANHAIVHSGTSSIQITIQAAAQALYLHHDDFGVTTGQVSFWLNGGASGGQLLQVAMVVDGKALPGVPIDPLPPNTWTQVTVPFSKLGIENHGGVNGLWIQDRSGKAQPPFYVDDISLTIDRPYVPPPVMPVPRANLTIDTSRTIKVIDSRMFGLNTAVWDSHLADPESTQLLKAAGITTLRFPGGSTSDDYDWSTGKVTSGHLWSTNITSFARTAEALKATSYIIVNYGTGTPQMAAAWVAYCNGSASDGRPIGVDSRGRDWMTIAYWAALRGSTPLAVDDGLNFLRAGHPRPYAFHYWEIGNECYGSWEADSHGSPTTSGMLSSPLPLRNSDHTTRTVSMLPSTTRAVLLPGKPHDGATYGQAACDYLKQMRAVDSSIRIGVVSAAQWDGGSGSGVVDPVEHTSHNGFTPVALAALRAAGTLPDFVIVHRYVQMDGTHHGDMALLQAGSTGWAVDVANVRKMVTDYIGGPEANRIELDCTETNSGSMSSKEGTSLTNGLFLADTSATAMSTELKSLIWWDFRNSETSADDDPALYGWRPYGDDGMVSIGNRKDCPLNTLFPPYYAEKLLTKWARGGDALVTATSDVPQMSVYAARHSSGELTLLVINKQNNVDMTATIKILGFTPSSHQARAYRYGEPEDRNQRDLTPFAVDGVASTFTATFPAYSMTVICVK